MLFTRFLSTRAQCKVHLSPSVWTRSPRTLSVLSSSVTAEKSGGLFFNLKPLWLSVAEDAGFSLAASFLSKCLHFAQKHLFLMLDCFIVVRCLWRLCISVTRLLVLCAAFTAEQYQQHQQQLALMQQQQLAQTQQQQASRNSSTTAPQVREGLGSYNYPSLFPTRAHL